MSYVRPFASFSFFSLSMAGFFQMDDQPAMERGIRWMALYSSLFFFLLFYYLFIYSVDFSFLFSIYPSIEWKHLPGSSRPAPSPSTSSCSHCIIQAETSFMIIIITCLSACLLLCYTSFIEGKERKGKERKGKARSIDRWTDVQKLNVKF